MSKIDLENHMHEARARLLNDALRRFVEVVSALPEVHSIRLFGSVANGEIGEWSDLDLAVVMETDLLFWERATALKRSVHSGIATDLVVYTPDEWPNALQANPFVREEISERGRLLYDRNLAPVAR